jgi:HECT-domain (ubiquitin-transferase)
MISCFEPRELENLICGFERVDIEDLQKNTFIDISPDHPRPEIVAWYWEAVSSFGQIDLSKLVQFVTGSSQVPVGGFASLRVGVVLMCTCVPVHVHVVCVCVCVCVCVGVFASGWGVSCAVK